MGDNAAIDMPGDTSQTSPHLKRGTHICGCHVGEGQIKALVVGGAVVLSVGVVTFLTLFILGEPWLYAIPFLAAIVVGGVLLPLGISAKRRALREYHALPMDHEDRVKYGGSTHPAAAAHTAASPYAPTTDDPPPSYDQSH